MKTLFLDRDGVINKRLPGAYVQSPEQFTFADGVLEVMAELSRRYDRIFVVTNQQGIGKGLMTEDDLQAIHEYMLEEVRKAGGRIDAVYYCPDLAINENNCRKPNPYMALLAKKAFPETNFKKSVIVGDSISDMLFGKRLGMKTVLIRSNPEQVAKASILTVDEQYDDLRSFASHVGLSSTEHSERRDYLG